MNTQLIRRFVIALFALTIFLASLPAAFADGPTDKGLRDANWDSIGPDGAITRVDTSRPTTLIADELPLGLGRDTAHKLERLPDLGKTDDSSTDKVIGPVDSRVRINPTNSYPWSAVAMLEITRGNGATTFCSGFFIGRHTVITAGHCIYKHAQGGWNRSVRVIPAKNGATEPYGSQTVATASLRSTVGWVNNANPRYDYGAILLPNDILGNRTGTFGYGAYSDATLQNSTINTAGYPGDKAYGTMWFNAGTVTNVDSLMIHYNADTEGGQSGSAVWRLVNGSRYVVAVHAYGYGAGSPCNGTTNCGARVTQSVFNLFSAWRA